MTTTDNQRILDCIRRLVRYLRLSDRAAQALVGLSGAQLFVLNELGKTPALSLNELADRTRTDQSSVSVVVTRLVDAGLVSRERSRDDARRLVLTLTKSGRAAVQKAPRAAQERILAALEHMPPAERRHFADTFTVILDAIGAESAAPMLFEDEQNPPPRPAPRRRKNTISSGS